MKTLNFIFDEFVDVAKSTRNLSEKTAIAYRSDLYDFIRTINPNEIDDKAYYYVQELSQIRKLKDSSIKRKLAVLKLFFEYCYINKCFDEKYYTCHDFKFMREKRLPKTLEIKETAMILTFLYEKQKSAKAVFEQRKVARNIALFDVLISTGIRIAEASNISLKDIFISEHTILINGKGRKQRLIHISCSDTEKYTSVDRGQKNAVNKNRLSFCQSVWRTNKHTWNRIYF